MLTPISSLQNVIAVAQLQEQGIEISFMRWMSVAVPFGLLGTLISWLIIMYIYPPTNVNKIPVVVIDLESSKITTKSFIVIIVSLITCVMFASFTYFKSIFGGIGIVALSYIVFMYGTGLLSEVDFNSLSWHTLMLLGGGSVLGKAVESSGLLALLSEGIIGGECCSNV